MPQFDPSSAQQEQFLEVIDRDEAERRFFAAVDPRPLGVETVPLINAHGRVLAEDIRAAIDVPGFDRANVDGFAVRAADTYGAEELHPVFLRLNQEAAVPGRPPKSDVVSGTAMEIATGAMVPRGADAVVMIEFAELIEGRLRLSRPATPGQNITFAGTDIGRGETVLRRGEPLTARETGVLAALGLAAVPVFRQPKLAIFSTGDELAAPGSLAPPGSIYDSNSVMLADAVREVGGEAVLLGIARDDAGSLRQLLREALQYDGVILSGGTSKGAGDLCYRVVGELGPPGIVVHGVALKPGKPVCLAVHRGTPVVILPGFPTSALFTFHEFVAPVIRRLAGRPNAAAAVVEARLPLRVNSERGRTEYVLVGLIENSPPPVPRGPFPANRPAEPTEPTLDRRPLLGGELLAFPMGKGSGSVTAFSRADGFIAIPRQREFLEAGEIVKVQLLGAALQPAELIVIGSHCVGLDYLLGELQKGGVRSKFLAVGSQAGLLAARRGQCDLAGIHLLDPATGRYNVPFLGDDLQLIAGYGRLQGVVFRPGDQRFEGKLAATAIRAVAGDANCLMVNRNRGSGTRILVDQLLSGARPAGYASEARSHHAVAAAVAQGRADWGVCIETVARDAGLGFLPLQQEHFDFVVHRTRWDRPAVRRFRALIEQPEIRGCLMRLGFHLQVPLP